MRITINRMRGSLAHKVGSGQAVFRGMEFWRGTGNMNPTATGNFQLRAGHPQLGWAYIKAGR